MGWDKSKKKGGGWKRKKTEGNEKSGKGWEGKKERRWKKEERT